MQGTRGAQRENGNFGIEFGAIIFYHLVTPLHGAYRGLKNGAAGVLKTDPRFQPGLHSNDTLATHFLHLIIGIGNDPVATDEFCRPWPGIGDGDGVGKGIAMVLGP